MKHKFLFEERIVYLMMIIKKMFMEKLNLEKEELTD